MQRWVERGQERPRRGKKKKVKNLQRMENQARIGCVCVCVWEGYKDGKDSGREEEEEEEEKKKKNGIMEVIEVVPSSMLRYDE